MSDATMTLEQRDAAVASALKVGDFARMTALRIATRLAEIERIANAYPPEVSCTPKWEREQYFSAAQQEAWVLRFGHHANNASAIVAGVAAGTTEATTQADRASFADLREHHSERIGA